MENHSGCESYLVYLDDFSSFASTQHEHLIRIRKYITATITHAVYFHRATSFHTESSSMQNYVNSLYVLIYI